MTDPTGLPSQIICPTCAEHGQAGNPEILPHFWKLDQIRDDSGMLRWLLGFVCDANHHWVIQLDPGSTGITLTQRIVSCPGLRDCPMTFADE